VTALTPTPGLWLRVTPDGKSHAVEVKHITSGKLSFVMWYRYGVTKRVDLDPKGTIYYPISKEILEAAEEMANTLTLVYECVAVRAYRAAVEKAVSK